MHICKEVSKKHAPAVKAIQVQVGETVKAFLNEYQGVFEKMVRDEMLMGTMGEVHSLKIGDSLIHLRIVESTQFKRARSFISNNTTGMSMQLLMSSLTQAEEKGLTELPSHLAGHIVENGARTWHWEAVMEVNELSGEHEQLFTDTTAAIVALSILAKENKTWLECALSFPETSTKDVLPITPSTIYDACGFATAPHTAYMEAAKRYCGRTYTLADLVNMNLIHFTNEDVELNKASWAKEVAAKEAETSKETKVEKV
tara:strand:+ start:7617 stop:8387 length:771 start_codon:yes stop_codon:yes gene_type:complete